MTECTASAGSGPSNEGRPICAFRENWHLIRIYMSTIIADSMPFSSSRRQ
jgi:hypothetical protein